MSRRWVEEGMNPLPLVVGKQIARLPPVPRMKEGKTDSCSYRMGTGRLPPIPKRRAGCLLVLGCKELRLPSSLDKRRKKDGLLLFLR